jgi:S-formylglutathione hydrolase
MNRDADWTTTTIAGKPADMFTPRAAPRFSLLFLHPYGNETLAHPATNPAWTEALAAAGLACICPHAPQTWWSNRAYRAFDDTITAETHVVQQVLPWMRSRWALPDRAVALAGISMGGQGALRIAFRQASAFPVVASVAGAIDHYQHFDDYAELPDLYRNREHCRQDSATLHVPQRDPPRHIFIACDPADDVWFAGNDRLCEKLRAVGVPHTADLATSHGGHQWDYFNAMAEPVVRFCLAGLERESRRLTTPLEMVC